MLRFPVAARRLRDVGPRFMLSIAAEQMWRTAGDVAADIEPSLKHATKVSVPYDVDRLLADSFRSSPTRCPHPGAAGTSWGL